MRIPGKKILDIFKGIDTNKDKQLSHKELYNMGKAAGLEKGFFVDERAEVADSFLDKFDTNKDKSVSWKEFQKNSMSLIPKDAFNGDGEINADKVKEQVSGVIKEVDVNSDGKLSKKEMEEYGEASLKEADVYFPGTKAVIGTKVATHLLDDDGDGKLSKDEILTPVEDAVKEVNKAKAEEGAEALEPNS
jgi:Ca2+-binding EF-hand superfamily protein